MPPVVKKNDRGRTYLKRTKRPKGYKRKIGGKKITKIVNEGQEWKRRGGCEKEKLVGPFLTIIR